MVVIGDFVRDKATNEIGQIINTQLVTIGTPKDNEQYLNCTVKWSFGDISNISFWYLEKVTL